MTDDKIALRALLEKGSDTIFLREMIGFAAERLMALETESLCNAAPGERAPERQNQRNGRGGWPNSNTGISGISA
jgi:putative transposase